MDGRQPQQRRVLAEGQVFRQLLEPDVRAALFSLSTEMRETLYWVAIEGMSYPIHEGHPLRASARGWQQLQVGVR